jgi:hypothetical protein
LYVVTEYQYQQLRNYCKEAVVDEIGKQPLKEESQTTAVQQLKAEIAALVTEFEFRYKHGAYIEMDVLINKLRQLSAI